MSGASFLAQKFYKYTDPPINQYIKAHCIDLVHISAKNILTNSNSLVPLCSKSFVYMVDKSLIFDLLINL